MAETLIGRLCQECSRCYGTGLIIYEGQCGECNGLGKKLTAEGEEIISLVKEFLIR
jgi:DnaJ-class molecular chaperone